MLFDWLKDYWRIYWADILVVVLLAIAILGVLLFISYL